MSADDAGVPDDDAIAAGARRALERLASVEPAGSWDEVPRQAQRVRRRRLASVSGAAAVALVAVGALAIATTDGGTRSGRRVGTEGTTTTAGATTSTSAATVTTGPTVTTPTGPTATGGSGVAPPPIGTIYPGDAPGVDDFTGHIGATRGGDLPVTSMDVLDEVDVGGSITNVTGRTIWASSSLVSRALAIVCANQTATVQSLFPFTNFRMAPGDSDGGGGRFQPTHDYIGTVTCTLDVIEPGSGTQFDPAAGGEDARATIVGPVHRVAPVAIEVRPVTFTLDRLGRLRPGTLSIGGSEEADVVAAMGPPDATTTGTFAVPDRPEYRALGYDCSDAPAADRVPMHVQPATVGPYCRTIFFLNVDTERVAGFRSTSTLFRTDRGTTVGTTEADAVKNEQTPLSGSCFTGIQIRDPQNDVEIRVYVGTQPTDPVTQLAAEEDMNDVGLFFC